MRVDFSEAETWGHRIEWSPQDIETWPNIIAQSYIATILFTFKTWIIAITYTVRAVNATRSLPKTWHELASCFVYCFVLWARTKPNIYIYIYIRNPDLTRITFMARTVFLIQITSVGPVGLWSGSQMGRARWMCYSYWRIQIYSVVDTYDWVSFSVNHYHIPTSQRVYHSQRALYWAVAETHY